jgi:hypothetical protein
VTEVLRVHFTATGTAAWMITRGEVSSQDRGDPRQVTACELGGQGTLSLDFGDGLGNGLVVPENALTFGYVGGAAVTVSFRIYYHMKIVENDELYSYMVNQGSANN